ncbi:unnamed protein product [Caenorhabditis angaria]|uniref:C-type lectin domain-containing protein n=1 Tax=Caenorhabditis angaria TaxID=860376 RepID=A0A9P1IRH4_9PELO|nr:unnamed protein product [Caenorhabditis angaria]
MFIQIFVLFLEFFSFTVVFGGNCQIEDCLFSVDNYTCPESYTKVTRTMGEYCIKVKAGSLDTFGAEADCQTENSVLASIESPDEANLILELSLTATSTEGWCWVGAQRLAACYGENFADYACQPLKTASFRWTDGFTVGTDGFIFTDPQPNNLAYNQNCLALVSASSSYLSGQNLAPGSLGDAPCNMTDQVVSYACGQPATISST